MPRGKQPCGHRLCRGVRRCSSDSAPVLLVASENQHIDGLNHLLRREQDAGIAVVALARLALSR